MENDPGFVPLSAGGLAQLKKLKEPFTALQVAAVCGIGMKQAANALTRWSDKDLITRVDRGQYARAKASDNSPPAPRAITPTVEKVPVVSQATTDIGGKITTLAGAMKAEIARLGPKFSRELLLKVISANYADEPLIANLTAGGFDNNLAYWASKGKLEKIGVGSLCSFRISEPDFFDHVES